MEYKTIVFIDTNIALQCLDLKQLPWFEIDRTGPVLILVTPTMLREVDGKKNDGRLGNHARRFNNLLRPLLGTAEIVTVRAKPSPQVDVALARCSPIQWSTFPELDSSEPDSRLIAEALHTETPPAVRKVFVSQDIRPLDLARRHGFQIHHVDENWLRQKEMSEAERRAAALSRELVALKSREPELVFEWGSIQSPIEIVRVNDISDDVRKAMLEKIRKANPMPTQTLPNDHIGSTLHGYDFSLEERYKKWSSHLLPNFVRQLERKLELLYNQIEISLTLKNVGKVQADSLLLKLSSTGGWMNSKLILVPPEGPSVPRPKPFSPFDASHFATIPKQLLPHGKHDVIVVDEPKRSGCVQITCNDFRHGSAYEYKFVCWLDPHSEAPFELSAIATAANLHGEATSCLVLQKRIESSEVSDLIDSETQKYRKQSLAQKRLLQTGGRDFSAFEFEKYRDDE